MRSRLLRSRPQELGNADAEVIRVHDDVRHVCDREHVQDEVEGAQAPKEARTSFV